MTICELKTDVVKREIFRDAYAKAILKGRDTFEFDGNEFYVPYAKYVLEYLDSLRRKA